MTKSSPHRKTRRKAKKSKVPAPKKPAQDPPEPALTGDQKYIRTLYEQYKKSPISVQKDQAAMLKLMAESEQKIMGAAKQTNEVQCQIKDLQLQSVELGQFITHEQGIVQGLGKALLSLR